LGITINELSSKTGINPENIAAIEKGKIQLGLEEFLEITRAIGIDPSKILEDID
jgi:transcriptional regulator with XRE-family HTH domain